MSNYEFKMGMYLGELWQPWEQSLATARDLVPAPPIPTRRWPTSNDPTSWPPVSARRTKPSTAPWTGSTAAAPSPPTASASSTCSELYEKMLVPLAAKAKPKRRRRTGG